MLGIKKALEQFRKFPNDPYVVIPKTNIELRFDEDGSILAAHNADDKDPKTNRFRSAQFEEMLKVARFARGL